MKLFSLIFSVLFILFSMNGCSKKPLPPPRGEVTILSEPAGAVVILGSKVQKKTTPLKGKIPPGTYVVRMEKKGYLPYFTAFKIENGSKKTIQANLVQESADVLIRSVPSGAEVFFEQSKRGVTPLVLKNLPQGSYTALLKLPGFSEKSIQWEMSGLRPKLITCELSSNIGTLKIQSEPAGAMISIDGKEAGETPLTERKSQGHYKVLVTKKGYSSYETEVSVKSGDTSLVKARLVQLPGSIRINCRTSGAQIKINGRDYGTNPGKIKGLQPGNYKIEVSRSGFDTAARQVKLEADQHLELDFALDSNTGGIDLITYPSGVKVYLNGKAVGTTEKDPNQPECSKVFQIRNLAVGKYELMLAHKRAKPNKVKKTIIVDKGRIMRLNNLKLWVANAVIQLKDGNRKITGCLVFDSGKENIVFQPEPGITYTYKKSDLVSLQKIQEEE